MRKNVIEYFEENYQNASQKIAVREGEREITFEQLSTMAKSLACQIMSAYDLINQPIAVFLPKSIESVVADTAITYSSNIYMNLDIKNPEVRLKNIIAKIEPKLIITNNENLPRLQSFNTGNIAVLNISFLQDANPPSASLLKKLFNRIEDLIDSDPYCIINTSGSTGTPKGVVLNHKSFIDFTEWSIETLKISDEIIGSLSPLYFDIYSFELCLLMAKTATLVIVPEQMAAFPAKIIEFLQDNQVNFIFWVPTIMVNISNLDLFSTYTLPALKKVLFAGEVFPTKHLNYWRSNLPHATFINLYGPIEITLDCTYYVVNKDLPNEQPVPIGFPCRNTDVLVLNEENKVAAVNEKGELCVRGTSLAMGYYNDPEKTSKAFVQNPLNNKYPELIYRTGDVVFKNEEGEIIFVGRKDFQIKHLGYRIDLSEIEHVIVNTWGKIPNACILYNNKKKEIVMIYEASEEISVNIFRTEILQLLPKYMVPTQFRLFEQLPRNPNGKIDRNALATLINNE